MGTYVTTKLLKIIDTQIKYRSNRKQAVNNHVKTHFYKVKH